MDTIVQISPALLALVPVIMGVVEVAKKLGLTTRYAPTLALILGIGSVIGLEGFSAASVVVGAVIGLTSAGLYSGTKTSFK